MNKTTFKHLELDNAGKIFPGHGGIIDRMDSVNFVLIVIYCYTLLLK